MSFQLFLNFRNNRWFTIFIQVNSPFRPFQIFSGHSGALLNTDKDDYA